MTTDLFIAILRSAWTRNRAYALRLVGDLTPDQFFAEPVHGRIINHPAWILSHLNVYAHTAADLLRARPVEDPATKPYSRGSKVTLNPSDYTAPPEIVEAFSRLHNDATQALNSAALAVFAAPNPIDRMRAVAPTVGELLAILMIKHESFHLGQLSAWRRAIGLPSVEM